MATSTSKFTLLFSILVMIMLVLFSNNVDALQASGSSVGGTLSVRMDHSSLKEKTGPKNIAAVHTTGGPTPTGDRVSRSPALAH
ncbi:hypothetical protein OROGR_010883 [Orobanche gracilis]